MKIPSKNVIVAAVILFSAMFSIGATLGTGDRPDRIASDRWISLGSQAGLAVGRLSRDGGSVNVEMFVKIDGKWRRGMLLNGAVYQEVQP